MLDYRKKNIRPSKRSTISRKDTYLAILDKIDGKLPVTFADNVIIFYAHAFQFFRIKVNNDKRFNPINTHRELPYVDAEYEAVL